MVSDMPPSYEIAAGNVTASHPLLPFGSKDYEIGRLEKEIQRLEKEIQKLKFICILVLIMMIAIVTVTTTISFDIIPFRK